MIPDKLTCFYCYNEGNDMIGIADVDLPEFAYMTESIKGAGIAGEIDGPAVGQFQSMTTTINWRSLDESNSALIAPDTYHFDFRGSVQRYDEASHEYKHLKVAVVMKCLPKKISIGKFDTATGMGTSGEFEVLYIKISINNKEQIELDKINMIYKVNGTDYLLQTRQNIGREY